MQGTKPQKAHALFNRLYPPRCPEGVTLILKDGSSVPVELVYDGIVVSEGQQLHQWHITTKVPLPKLLRMDVSMMPAKTTIVIDGPLDADAELCTGCENGKVPFESRGKTVMVPHGVCRGTGRVAAT